MNRPAVGGCVAVVDGAGVWFQVFRRAAASVITLGSGASLGPEAPSVELGANTAAVFAPKHLSKRRQRMLVAAGAAAGGRCLSRLCAGLGKSVVCLAAWLAGSRVECIVAPTP